MLSKRGPPNFLKRRLVQVQSASATPVPLNLEQSLLRTFCKTGLWVEHDSSSQAARKLTKSRRQLGIFAGWASGVGVRISLNSLDSTKPGIRLIQVSAHVFGRLVDR